MDFVDLVEHEHEESRQKRKRARHTVWLSTGYLPVIFDMLCVHLPRDLARMVAQRMTAADIDFALGRMPVNEICEYAMISHHLELFTLAYRPFGWVKAVDVASYGHIDMMRHLIDVGGKLDEDVCATAAQFGRLDLLKWLRGADQNFKSRCPWDEGTCEKAASTGRIDVLKWVRSPGPGIAPCPWSEWTPTFAANNGELEALKWLRNPGPGLEPCPWSNQVIGWAEQFGHTHIIEWAIANGCPG